MNREFWDTLNKLVQSSEIVIDRPKSSHHPCHPEIIYPIDYGYLKSTQSADGEGIDCWIGSFHKTTVTAIIVTVDAMKRDSEIKLLLGCNKEEEDIIYRFHNQGYMKGIMIRNEQNNY
jgi:inorganic pyrophosphatase